MKLILYEPSRKQILRFLGASKTQFYFRPATGDATRWQPATRHWCDCARSGLLCALLLSSSPFLPLPSFLSTPGRIAMATCSGGAAARPLCFWLPSCSVRPPPHSPLPLLPPPHWEHFLIFAVWYSCLGCDPNGRCAPPQPQPQPGFHCASPVPPRVRSTTAVSLAGTRPPADGGPSRLLILL